MIEIVDKKDCVGCAACVQRCPKQCISMSEDEQGFIYPKVDTDLCIHCNLCEKVCPVIHPYEARKPLQTFAAGNLEEGVRKASSSGGVFFALSGEIIDEGGVVFGAKFDENMEVVHDYADTLAGIRSFQGSKYVQSRIGDTFLRAEEFLKAGRRVMFTGTPCQIAGLKHFLNKDYGRQLLTVDIVCHGVPSPLVWRDYLRYIVRPEDACDDENSGSEFSLSASGKPKISRISFRDKRLGWEKYGFSVYTSEKGTGEKELLFEPFVKNLFMQGFLKDLYLRPSCYACPAKCVKSHSDITLGDFWGIESCQPKDYDEAGVSLVLANTPEGERILDCVGEKGVQLVPSTYENALRGNPAIERSATKTRWVEEFWRLYPTRGIASIAPMAQKAGPPLSRRLLSRMIRLARKILGPRLSSAIKSIIKR